jgi:enoyl-CoA hydratase/carnithine racemase
MNKATFSTEGSLGVVTINDSPYNFMGQELIDDLHSVIDGLFEKNLRGLLIQCNGSNFSAGANMSLFKGKDSDGGREVTTSILKLFRKIQELPYPTLAAVRGLCLGGGFELALSCDLIWAASDAKLGSPEATIGTIPLGGGSRGIVARAGVAMAKEMVYEGKFYTAEKLEQWNIVNKVLPDAELNEQALKYMKKLCEGATLAHAVNKKLHNEYYNNGLDSSDNLLLEIVPPLFETEDFINGVKSLMENGPGKAKFNAR